MACLRFAKRVWGSFLETGGHDANCFPKLEIKRAVPGLVECSLPIEGHQLNRVKTLHGGLIASLVDTMGSLAVASRGYYMTGVSTDISTSFVRAAGTEGNSIKLTGKVIGLGKSLAYTRVEVHDDRGRLVAFGSHTKYVGGAKNDKHGILKFSEDGETIVEGSEGGSA